MTTKDKTPTETKLLTYFKWDHKEPKGKDNKSDPGYKDTKKQKNSSHGYPHVRHTVGEEIYHHPSRDP